MQQKHVDDVVGVMSVSRVTPSRLITHHKCNLTALARDLKPEKRLIKIFFSKYKQDIITQRNLVETTKHE